MKKVLLGASALVMAGLMAAPAQAQLEARVGLDVRSVMSAYDLNDDKTMNNSGSFLTDFRMPVSVSGTADNGLRYGAMVRIRSQGGAAGQNTLRWDRAFVNLGGNWGTVELGQSWGALQKNLVHAPLSTVGSWDSGYTPLATGNAGGYVGRTYGIAHRALYQSPSFSGFNVAASFGPENASGHTFQTSNAVRRDTNLFEISAGYSGDFNGIGINVGGGYAGGQRNGGPAGVIDPIQRLEQWQIGATVSWGGITVGGSYWDQGRSGRVSTGSRNTGWSAGASYSMGAWSFNGNLIAGSADSAVTGGRETDYMYTLGVGYQLAPGLSIGADFQANDLGSDRKTDGTRIRGNAGVSRLRVTF